MFDFLGGVCGVPVGTGIAYLCAMGSKDFELQHAYGDT